MEKLIAMVGEEDSSTAIGNIRLDDVCESFYSGLKDWSVRDYYYQWHHSAKYSLEQRNTSAFITNFEKPTAKNPVQCIQIYSIIPKEYTNKRKYFNWEDEELNKLGFVMTEGCIHITDNAELLANGKAIEFIEKAYDYPLPVYYFNVKRMEYFYLYISEVTKGISAWDISLDELKATKKFAGQKIVNQ